MVVVVVGKLVEEGCVHVGVVRVWERVGEEILLMQVGG